MSVLTRPEVRRLVERPVLGRLLAGRLVAGVRAEDGLGVAAALAAEGHPVALEHRPGPGDDGAAELAALIALVRSSGPPGDCELTVPVDRPDVARRLAGEAAAAGLGVAFDGDPEPVDALLGRHPGARTVVRAGEPGAQARCRALAGSRVRLRGSGPAARPAFVRCVDILMAGDGGPAVATGDPRLVAITGERAAWHGRAPESWEHVMPWNVRTPEQQRLAAAGATVRVAVVSGAGAVAALLGCPGGLR
ncbi:hypothetical protein [Blastococcus goldschmidtiae]|uniref:LUD domain-containing protein n=1 Tax=Blastococcus goldschmidtiae TaxID=3075546 RepID=A0ABU2K3S8_9ACTN|nr:hypothetical protein [Blastococcus sp. DSM 46792]MDT0274843.1 hypothetical protein [Blastococcus sp. DSM 46792]